ncbi:hypothetical protein E4U42_007397 [Claviceps africana]|uniref:Peroxin 26 n=1 Tax=Claviceps africana TaxID=83212 RepID=A0A8K0J1S8_9HYPO|nr:hypothetical protein E4U42_007397 [Claviceps africana]
MPPSVDGSHLPASSPTMTAFSSDAYCGHNNILSSSMAPLRSASTRSGQTSQISKTYRQASTLFLTRRLPEALTTLTPLIFPSGSAEDGEAAPVASASRTTRIKVWSLYLTILNAIVEMDSQEGKEAFGKQEWRTLCAKVRDGQVWEEVIHNGYHDVEGDVDSDVVINLATLLLAHARDQMLNQRRLETYLATTTTPNLDLAGKFNESPAPGSRYRSPAPGAKGADTPRDLNARVKILELYTLHVLLRNNEWDYAREFINVSSVLDEERREAFLQALQSLQEEQQEQERLEREERQRQDDKLRREVEEARRQKAENEAMERKRQEEERTRRGASMGDYGVEASPPASSKARQGRPARRPSKSSMSSRSNNSKAVSRPTTFTAQASIVLRRLQDAFQELAASLHGSPALLMRFMAFLVGFLLMLGHRGLRQRVQRILGVSWSKVLATVGMGTKVSYI